MDQWRRPTRMAGISECGRGLLWASVIEQKFYIRLGVTAVEELPAKLGLMARSQGWRSTQTRPASALQRPHSGERVAYVVARRIVGIDVELIRPVADAVGIARRFFAEGEYRQLRHLYGPALMEAFLRRWTLKEAYMKAKGVGFGLALDSFSLSFDAAQPHLIGESEQATPWQFAAWTDEGYAMAVAVAAIEGPLQIQKCHWEQC